MNPTKMLHYLGLSYDHNLAYHLQWFKREIGDYLQIWKEQYPAVKSYPPIFFDENKQRFVLMNIPPKDIGIYSQMVSDLLESNNAPRKVLQGMRKS